MTRKLVSLSEDTLKKLGKIAKPFESPNKCMGRILHNLQNKTNEFSKENEDQNKNKQEDMHKKLRFLQDDVLKKSDASVSLSRVIDSILRKVLK